MSSGGPRIASMPTPNSESGGGDTDQVLQRHGVVQRQAFGRGTAVVARLRAHRLQDLGLDFRPRPRRDAARLRRRRHALARTDAGGEGAQTCQQHERSLSSSHALHRRRSLRAWFRILFVLGETYVNFWHQQTARYRPLDAQEAQTPWAAELRRVTQQIAKVSGMALFSTELAIAAAGHVVAVDYVNDMCDLRLASATPDGVPDALVAAVAERIVAVAAQVRS
jgi:hypothetical protein